MAIRICERRAQTFADIKSRVPWARQYGNAEIRKAVVLYSRRWGETVVRPKGFSSKRFDVGYRLPFRIGLESPELREGEMFALLQPRRNAFREISGMDQDDWYFAEGAWAEDPWLLCPKCDMCGKKVRPPAREQQLFYCALCADYAATIVYRTRKGVEAVTPLLRDIKTATNERRIT